MISPALKERIRNAYLQASDAGDVDDEIASVVEEVGRFDPSFAGSLRQEASDRRRKRPVISPSSEVTPNQIGYEEARDEFFAHPRETMNSYAPISVSPDGKGGAFANWPLEKGSFPSQLANVAESVPVVGPLFDSLIRTDNEARVPEDQNEVMGLGKGISWAIPIAAGVAGGATALGAGPVLAGATAGGVTDVALGGVPFVGDQTTERSLQRTAQVGFSALTGGAAGAVNKYIAKWAGDRALDSVRKLAKAPVVADEIAKVAASTKANPTAIIQALTGGDIESVSPVIRKIAEDHGGKLMSNATKRLLNTSMQDTARQALLKEGASDLALGVAQTYANAGVEGRTPEAAEFAGAVIPPAITHGIRGAQVHMGANAATGMVPRDAADKVATQKAKQAIAPETKAAAEEDAKAAFVATTKVDPATYVRPDHAAREAYKTVLERTGSEDAAKKASRTAAMKARNAMSPENKADYEAYKAEKKVVDAREKQRVRDEVAAARLRDDAAKKNAEAEKLAQDAKREPDAAKSKELKGKAKARAAESVEATRAATKIENKVKAEEAPKPVVDELPPDPVPAPVAEPPAFVDPVTINGPLEPDVPTPLSLEELNAKRVQEAEDRKQAKIGVKPVEVEPPPVTPGMTQTIKPKKVKASKAEKAPLPEDTSVIPEQFRSVFEQRTVAEESESKARHDEANRRQIEIFEEAERRALAKANFEAPIVEEAPPVVSPRTINDLKVAESLPDGSKRYDFGPETPEPVVEPAPKATPPKPTKKAKAKPYIKRAKDFATTGNWEVELPGGRVVNIYKNADDKWWYETGNDEFALSTETSIEAVEALKKRYPYIPEPTAPVSDPANAFNRLNELYIRAEHDYNAKFPEEQDFENFSSERKATFEYLQELEIERDKAQEVRDKTYRDLSHRPDSAKDIEPAVERAKVHGVDITDLHKSAAREDKILEQMDATARKVLNNAEVSAKGAEGMKAAFDKAVKDGKTTPEIAAAWHSVMDKYKANLGHLNVAFIDPKAIPGSKGVFDATRNTILLAAEKMNHEGLAAALEEMFHGMEKVLPVEQRIQIQKEFMRDVEGEIQSLLSARQLAIKEGMTKMVADIDGTIKWIQDAAANEGKMPGLPPIEGYYKFLNRSEYYASKMIDYEWDRIVDFIHPHDKTIWGQGSKFIRDLSVGLTDAYEQIVGKDKMNEVWRKLPKASPVQDTNLTQAEWYGSPESMKQWANDLAFRPDFGGIKQDALPPDVDAAMKQSSPTSFERRSYKDRMIRRFGGDEKKAKGVAQTILVKKLFDKHIFFKRLEEANGEWNSAVAGKQLGRHPMDSGYQALLNYEQRHNIFQHLIRMGSLKMNGQTGEMSPIEGTRGLEAIWKDAYQGKGEHTLAAYLFASRAADTLKTKGIDPGAHWSKDTLAHAVLQGDKVLELPDGRKVTVKQLGEEVQTFVRHGLRMLEDAGVLDPEAVKKWEEAMYVPFLLEESLSRIYDDQGDMGVFTDSAHAPDFGDASYMDQVGRVGKLTEALTSAEADIYKRGSWKEGMEYTDILEGIAKMQKHMVAMSLKNRAARRNLEIMASMDNPVAERLGTEVPKNMRTTVSVLENGKKVYYKITDPVAYEFITNFGADKFQKFSQNPTVKALFVTPARLFADFIVRGPEFLLVNPVRDFLGAWATGIAGDTTSSRDAFVSAAKGMKNAYVGMFKTIFDFASGEVKEITRNPTMLKLSAAGLSGAGHYGSSARDVAGNIRGNIKSKSGKFRFINPLEYYKWMEHVGAVSELHARKMIYDQVKKHGGSETEAIARSMDLINYSKRGDSAVFGFLLDTVPFLSARMSGLDKLGRSLTTMPHKDRGTKAQLLASSVLTRMSMMALASSLLYAYNQLENKDRFDSLEKNTRDGYWHTWIGDTHLQLAKPFEAGLLGGSLPERLLDLTTGNNSLPEFAEFFWRNMVNTFQIAQPPHSLGPIIEQGMNKVRYSERPIVSPSAEGFEPEAQYTAGTSLTAKKVADAMPASAPDWARSPARIQHLLDSYLATVGEYSVMVTDMLLRQATGDQSLANNIMQQPGLRAIGRFVKYEPETTPVSNKYVASYYDFQNEMEASYNTMRNYQKLGRVDKAKEVEKRFKPNAAKYFEGKGVGKAVAAMRAEQKRVAESRTIAPSAKRERIDKLTVRINKMLSDFEKGRKN